MPDGHGAAARPKAAVGPRFPRPCHVWHTSRTATKPLHCNSSLAEPSLRHSAPLPPRLVSNHFLQPGNELGDSRFSVAHTQLHRGTRQRSSRQAELQTLINSTASSTRLSASRDTRDTAFPPAPQAPPQPPCSSRPATRGTLPPARRPPPVAARRWSSAPAPPTRPATAGQLSAAASASPAASHGCFPRPVAPSPTPSLRCAASAAEQQAPAPGLHHRIRVGASALVSGLSNALLRLRSGGCLRSGARPPDASGARCRRSPRSPRRPTLRWCR